MQALKRTADVRDNILSSGCQECDAPQYGGMAYSGHLGSSSVATVDDADASRTPGSCGLGQPTIRVIDTAGEDAASETLTVLRCRGRRLVKLVQPDGTVVGYDAARQFDMAAVRVADLDKLERVLRRLQLRRSCAVVRGEIADPGRTSDVRRLLHLDPKTGDLPTLRDVPRRWLALDIDGIPLPMGTDAADLAACGAVARSALPAEFHNAECIVQATGSHGIKPGARLRLWFWCDRPVSGHEAKDWLRGSPVDTAPFGAAQLIYTASPAFAPGHTDHLPQRMLRLPGVAYEVPFVAPEPRPKPLIRTASKPRSNPSQKVPEHRASATGGGAVPWGADSSAGMRRYAFAALIRATARVAAAPVNSRHSTALREACGLAPFIIAGCLSETEVSKAMSGGLVLAGKDADEGLAIVHWVVARHMANREDVL